MISVELERAYIEWIKLDGAISILTGLQHDYSKYENLRLIPDLNADGSEGLYLYGDRLETDYEYQDRLKIERNIEERDLREYERLKAKFGD